MLGRTVLALLACALVGAAAEGVHPLTDLPPPGDVTTGFFFPDHPNKKFTAGKPVTAVVGIRNDASEAYNITAVIGSLNSPTDFRMHIQNFTQEVYMRVLPAGQDLTLEYTFNPDYRLEARDFTVALTVVYHNSKDQYFSTTFFNQTVEIVDVKKLVDYEMVSLMVLLTGLACGAAYLAYTFAMSHLQNMGLLKKSKKTKVESTSRPDNDDEWIKNTPYDQFRKKRAATRSKQ